MRLVATEYLSLDGAFEEPGMDQKHLELADIKRFASGIVPGARAS